MGDEAKSLASEARRSRSERDADRLCRTESLPLIPTIKAWWWDSEKRQKLLQHIKKFPQSVDTERGNEYNTYRVRPKRSAIYEQVFSPIRGITALRTAGRLFFSDRYGYRFCVTPQRNKKHDNQLNHTSHLLSDGVLTAACP